MKKLFSLLSLFALVGNGCAGFWSPEADAASPEGRFNAAQKLLQGHQYAESVKAFKKVSQEFPNTEWAVKAQFGGAIAHITAENPRKDYVQALVEFDEFLERYPSHGLSADARNWRQAVKVILDEKKENERLLKNIEKLKQLDMRQEQKRLGR